MLHYYYVTYKLPRGRIVRKYIREERFQVYKQALAIIGGILLDYDEES